MFLFSMFGVWKQKRVSVSCFLCLEMETLFSYYFFIIGNGNLFPFPATPFGNGNLFLFPATPFGNGNLFPFPLQGKLFLHNLMLTDMILLVYFSVIHFM